MNMGTKNNPGAHDCYANAEPDEPMFVLLGRDPLAADLVAEWAARRELTRGPSPKVDEARACARSMTAWPKLSDPAPCAGTPPEKKG